MNDPDAYCREIETYLCRKNEGHLIRIVGPAFELVSGWARAGIPIKVASTGIDRYFERYYRRGPRRRPIRIEFCEADVLDAFDDWRRAVGIGVAGGEGEGQSEADHHGVARKGPSLSAHVEHVLARLTMLRGSTTERRVPDDALERFVRALDGLQSRATRARGETREAVVDALAALDRALIDSATSMLTTDERARLDAEAERELGPFRVRMLPDAYARAREAAVARLVRDELGLPRIAFE